MKKIKFIGLLILFISVALIALSNILSHQEEQFTHDLTFTNTQKSYSQEIAKTILYTHRYKKELPKNIDQKMYYFLSNLQLNQFNKHKDQKILELSRDFFELTNQFKYVYTGNVPYNIVILDKLVNNIYQKNMQLIVAFNQHTEHIKSYHQQKIDRYRMLQYLLFIILILLLLYAFTQIDEIIQFIQKFTKTSNQIIEQSTIKGLKPIDIESGNNDLGTATNNFNTLVSNIDRSIQIATESASYTIDTLEIIEKNIEQLISLLDEMQKEQKTDIYKKEDTLIESLETLMDLIVHLKSLKKDLKKLI